MALRKIHNTYYVYFRDIDGSIKTRSLQTHNKEDAEVMHAQYMRNLQFKRAELVVMRDFPERFKSGPPITTIAPEPEKKHDHERGSIALNKMWEIALTRRPLSKSHWQVWDKFVDRIDVRFADQVTPAKALKYLETYYNKGNGKTYNNVKSALNTIFRCCLVEAHLTESPFSPIINRRITEIDHHRNLTQDEFDRIFAISPKQLQIAMMLSRWTTQRLETCTRMTPEMFNFEKLVFIIDPSKNKRFDEWVCCPIMPELEEYIRPILLECRKKEKPIVQNFSSWPNSRYSLECCRLVKHLNIPTSYGAKASFHSIRGTAITWFKEHGVRGDELHSITGHDSTDVEDVYARDIASISRIARSFRV